MPSVLSVNGNIPQGASLFTLLILRNDNQNEWKWEIEESTHMVGVVRNLLNSVFFFGDTSLYYVAIFFL